MQPVRHVLKKLLIKAFGEDEDAREILEMCQEVGGMGDFFIL